MAETVQKLVLEVKLLPRIIDERGREVDSPWSVWKEGEDGERKLIGGEHRFSTGPQGERDVKAIVGEWVALPEKGGAWLANYFNRFAVKDGMSFDERIGKWCAIRARPEVVTIDDLTSLNPDIPVLNMDQWRQTQASELAAKPSNDAPGKSRKSKRA